MTTRSNPRRVVDDRTPPSSRQLKLYLAPRSVIRSWILLLLYHRPSHGYELVTRLQVLRADVNRGQVYRCLWWLDDKGLVRHRWHTSQSGPARRVYSIADAGVSTLELLVSGLRDAAACLERGSRSQAVAMLDSFGSHLHSFEFSVRAELSVEARDEESARRKLERLFGKVRGLDDGVRTTGEARIGDPVRASDPRTRCADKSLAPG